MNLQTLVAECAAAGVRIVVQGDAVSLEGDLDLIQQYASILRPYKEELLASGAVLDGWRDDLVQDSMEVDGLSQEETQALAAVSVAPRPPAEWMSLIQELDSMIDRYCQVCRLSDDARDRIREIRQKQSLESIPLAVDWFRRELGQTE